MEHGVVPSLESLELDGVSHEEAVDILKAVGLRTNDSFYNLKHFGMSMHLTRFLEAPWTVPPRTFGTFIEDRFIPFMKKSHNQSMLQSVKLGLLKSQIAAYDGCFDPVLSLLSSLPASLKRLELTTPIFLDCPSNPGMKQSASKKLVQKLCEMLSQQNEQSNLQNITLHEVKLSAETKKFLLFMFGYNNKMYYKDGSYHLSFL